MRDNRTRPETNFAHLPVVDGYGTPIDTHPDATPDDSVAPDEIAAGTVRVASQPVPTAITPRTQQDFMTLPTADSSHGAVMKPVGFGAGRTDTTGRD